MWREAKRDSQEELIWTAFMEEMEVSERLERVQKALENAVEDMDLMVRLLDELGKLQNQKQECDLSNVDSNINKLMPELGFALEDEDRWVASFSSGWQIRMSLGKILLQKICHGELLLVVNKEIACLFLIREMLFQVIFGSLAIRYMLNLKLVTLNSSVIMIAFGLPSYYF
ncbi:hypothetical protein RchiOBHm_Chr7g0224491 [Rosa chinensis]|uniref:Uncharacterized protein n=1 Tax=Rosa chinensis TaxID=74649 RepID=A0A2P6PDU5_ROSCH|nr:hypothetical protein RchiOBHm_Chr7g0224491 [Rosa chinensis]